MSGTSLDGVDAALVDFASGQPRVLATHFAPFPPALRAQFMSLQAPGDDELTRAALAANQLTQSYADGVAVPRDLEIERAKDLLVAKRPADICAEGESDLASDGGHDFLMLRVHVKEWTRQ